MSTVQVFFRGLIAYVDHGDRSMTALLINRQRADAMHQHYQHVQWGNVALPEIKLRGQNRITFHWTSGGGPDANLQIIRGAKDGDYPDRQAEASDFDWTPHIKTFLPSGSAGRVDSSLIDFDDRAATPSELIRATVELREGEIETSDLVTWDRAGSQEIVKLEFESVPDGVNIPPRVYADGAIWEVTPPEEDSILMMRIAPYGSGARSECCIVPLDATKPAQVLIDNIPRDQGCRSREGKHVAWLFDLLPPGERPSPAPYPVVPGESPDFPDAKHPPTPRRHPRRTDPTRICAEEAVPLVQPMFVPANPDDRPLCLGGGFGP